MAIAWLLTEGHVFRSTFDLRRLTEAQTLIKHALSVQRKKLGSHHPEIAVSGTIAALANPGNLSEVQKSLLELVEIFMRQEGGERIADIVLSYAQAGVAHKSGDFEATLAHYQAGSNSLREVLGENHPFHVLPHSSRWLACNGKWAARSRRRGRFAEHSMRYSPFTLRVIP